MFLAAVYCHKKKQQQTKTSGTIQRLNNCYMNVVRNGERDQGGEVGGMNIQTGGREGLREKDSREDSRHRFFSVPSWSLHLLRRPRFLQLEEPFLSPPLRPAGVSCFLLYWLLHCFLHWTKYLHQYLEGRQTPVLP